MPRSGRESKGSPRDDDDVRDLLGRLAGLLASSVVCGGPFSCRLPGSGSFGLMRSRSLLSFGAGTEAGHVNEQGRDKATSELTRCQGSFQALDDFGLQLDFLRVGAMLYQAEQDCLGVLQDEIGGLLHGVLAQLFND